MSVDKVIQVLQGIKANGEQKKAIAEAIKLLKAHKRKVQNTKHPDKHTRWF